MQVYSFAPVAAPDARVLVLGTMPGVASLRAGQYYGHPRNAFWRIMAELCALDPTDPYATRLAHLQAAGLALWDVLAACERPGSLDASIRAASEQPNDIAGLLAARPRIVLIALNGQRAAQLFKRHIWSDLKTENQLRLRVEVLPSTSPAYTLSLEEKTARWRDVIAPFLQRSVAQPGAR